MSDILTIITVVALAYAATNLDNFAILLALLSRFRRHVPWVIAGHLVVAATMTFLALAIGETAAHAPMSYIGLLGAVPVAIGLHWLYRLWRPAQRQDRAPREIHRAGIFLAVTTTLAANGVDSTLTLAVVFADTAPRLDWIGVATVLVAASLLAMLALRALGNPKLGPTIVRYASRLAPLVMIAVGLYVLADTATDLPGATP